MANSASSTPLLLQNLAHRKTQPVLLPIMACLWRGPRGLAVYITGKQTMHSALANSAAGSLNCVLLES